MRILGIWLAVLVVLTGCGGTHARTAGSPDEASGDEQAAVSESSAETEEDDDGPPVRPPELVWSEGEDRVTVGGVGVVVRVDAPLARLSRDELATPTCGDRMVHAMAVDRRISPDVETILGRAFLRAGCVLPEEATIIREPVQTEHEQTIVVRFADGEMAGDWVLHALVLDRAHRSLAIVSSVRVPSFGATAAAFEIVSDAPGLEAVVWTPPSTTTRTPTSSTTAADVVFGVLRFVGDVARAFVTH